MKPIYLSNYFYPGVISELKKLNWVRYTETREEIFMADQFKKYTYGKGKGLRTYLSQPYHWVVQRILDSLNKSGENKYNVCFLNKYNDQTQHLGWHSDDSSGTDLDHPIAVISFGEIREIWWRKKGTKGYPNGEEGGVVSLEPGSLFVMPAGFQREYEHKIPKGNRQNMGVRISLTYRHLL